MSCNVLINKEMRISFDLILVWIMQGDNFLGSAILWNPRLEDCFGGPSIVVFELCQLQARYDRGRWGN